jgi:hypothetical protein
MAGAMLKVINQGSERFLIQREKYIFPGLCQEFFAVGMICSGDFCA